MYIDGTEIVFISIVMLVSSFCVSDLCLCTILYYISLSKGQETVHYSLHSEKTGANDRIY